MFAAQQAVTNATGMEPSMAPTKPVASSGNSHRSQAAASEGAASSKQAPSSNGDGGAGNTQNDVLSAVTSLLQQSQQVRQLVKSRGLEWVISPCPIPFL
jgi:hypothetical protein